MSCITLSVDAVTLSVGIVTLSVGIVTLSEVEVRAHQARSSTPLRLTAPQTARTDNVYQACPLSLDAVTLSEGIVTLSEGIVTLSEVEVRAHPARSSTPLRLTAPQTVFDSAQTDSASDCLQLRSD